MPRDMAWERTAAATHANDLRVLLEKGQDLDGDLGGSLQGTLRDYLKSLRAEIDTALSK